MDAEQQMWQMVRSATPTDGAVEIVIFSAEDDDYFDMYLFPDANEGRNSCDSPLRARSSLKMVNGFIPVRLNGTISYVCADEVDVYALIEPTPYKQG